MPPNEKDKDTLVTDLLNKGLTARDIAKEAHVSFTDIKRIRTKLTGESDDAQNKKKESQSIPSQAFKLFLEGRSLVAVAIALDTPTEQVIRFYKDYLTLQRMSKFVSILDKRRDSIPTFLAWFAHIEKRGVKPEDFTVALEFAKDLQSLQKEKENLEAEMESLYSERDFLIQSIASLQNFQKTQASARCSSA